MMGYMSIATVVLLVLGALMLPASTLSQESIQFELAPSPCHNTAIERIAPGGCVGASCRPCTGTCRSRCGQNYTIGIGYCGKGCQCCQPDCSVETLAPCEALDGKCIGIDEECDGRVIIHKLFCKSADSCKCCFPGCDCENERKCDRPDAQGYYPTGHCRKQCHSDEKEYDTCDIANQDNCYCCLRSKGPCKPLTCNYNGTDGRCDQRDVVSGMVNVGTLQCKDGCQCHVPEIDPTVCKPAECKMPNGVVGNCSPVPIENSVNVGSIWCKDGCDCWIPDPNICIPAFCKTEDGVEGNCSRDPIENFMNAGQMQCKEGCNCWIPECRSIGDRCQRKGSFCIDPKEKCPVGFDESSDCFKPVLENGVWVKSQICKCCKPHQVDCENKYDCGDRLDYCVDKKSHDCPNKGYAILSNACFKTSPQYPEYTLRNPSEFVSLNISIQYSDCDCCKSLECRPIRDRCTGKGEFCIDPDTSKSCPIGYIGTDDCYKPVIKDGVWVLSKKCICCKPQIIDCGPVCLSGDITTCMCMLPGKPCPDGLCYYDSDLCGHNSCTCCKEAVQKDCESINNQCNAPDDYCVEKSSANCRKGFVKVSDACYRILGKKYCDCCKSLGCRPIGDRCSGRRDFCIDSEAQCPSFYKTSYDCYKVLPSGKWSKCKCCKPLFIEWIQQKFWEPMAIIPPTTTPQGECGGKDCEQGHCYYPHDRAPIPSCPRGSTALPCDCFAIGEICCSNILT